MKSIIFWVDPSVKVKGKRDGSFKKPFKTILDAIKNSSKDKGKSE